MVNKLFTEYTYNVLQVLVSLSEKKELLKCYRIINDGEFTKRRATPMLYFKGPVFLILFFLNSNL